MLKERSPDKTKYVFWTNPCNIFVTKIEINSKKIQCLQCKCNEFGGIDNNGCDCDGVNNYSHDCDNVDKHIYDCDGKNNYSYDCNAVDNYVYDFDYADN